MSQIERGKEVVDELMHYGIPGMRWGIRRRSSADKALSKDVASLRKAGFNKEADAVDQVRQKNAAKLTALKKKSENSSDEHTEVRKLLKKKSSQLTNEDLKKINRRLELEKKYSELTPVTLNRGLEISKKILAIPATIAAFYALSQTPLAKKLISAISKKPPIEYMI